MLSNILTENQWPYCFLTQCIQICFVVHKWEVVAEKNIVLIGCLNFYWISEIISHKCFIYTILLDASGPIEISKLSYNIDKKIETSLLKQNDPQKLIEKFTLVINIILAQWHTFLMKTQHIISYWCIGVNSVGHFNVCMCRSISWLLYAILYDVITGLHEILER